MKQEISERGAVFRGVLVGLWAAFVFAVLLQKAVPLTLICWEWAHRK